MQQRNVIIKNSHGLHARPASVLAKTASSFKSDIFLVYQNIKANAKSVLGLLVLAIEPNAEVTIITDGEDEIEAMQTLVDLVDKKFGTEE